MTFAFFKEFPRIYLSIMILRQCYVFCQYLFHFPLPGRKGKIQVSILVLVILLKFCDRALANDTFVGLTVLGNLDLKPPIYILSSISMVAPESKYLKRQNRKIECPLFLE